MFISFAFDDDDDHHKYWISLIFPCVKFLQADILQFGTNLYR